MRPHARPTPPFRSRVARAILVALALLLVAFPATASHATLSSLVDGETHRRTAEDDGARVGAYGTPLDGRENRVTQPGARPGDGGLFLDARLANALPTGVQSGQDLFAVNAAAGTLFPGALQTSAWYGWWLDLANPGVIDDLAGQREDEADEFAWRGLASGEGGLSILVFQMPSDAFAITAYGDGTGYSTRALSDGTREGDAWEHQQSTGYGRASADGGFLSTIETLALAGARATVGGGIPRDLDDPDALVDVDVYASASPDVEALWSAGVHGAVVGAYAVRDVALDLADEALATVAPLVASVEPHRRALLDLASSACVSLGCALAIKGKLTTPFDAKEPNHAEDDYEGRAIYGGAGDAAGSFNDYTGYKTSFHFWFDAYGRLVACGGAYARPPVGPTVEDSPLCVSTGEDPLSASTRETRGAGAMLALTARTVLWKDVNGDNWQGVVCDPDDPAEFDAERNACRESMLSRGVPYTPVTPHNERVPACEASNARGSTVRVAPVGEWAGAILARDYQHVSRVAFDLHWEVLEGSAPVELRLRDFCNSNNLDIGSRDAIYFPAGGSPVALRLESEAHIPGWLDVANGIVLGKERVRDVDLLPALL